MVTGGKQWDKTNIADVLIPCVMVNETSNSVDRHDVEAQVHLELIVQHATLCC